MGIALRSTAKPFSVELSADFDDGYRRGLLSDILRALDNGERHVVVNCDAWRRLDLPLLSTLIQCAKSCDSQGAMFEVVNIAPEVLACISALRLNGRLGLLH
jgi:anti-anti-sigma regulatory factor